MFKRKKDKVDSNPILLGMVMLKHNASPNLDNLRISYKEYYTDEFEIKHDMEDTIIINAGGETFAIAHMPYPIPKDGLQAVAQLAYNWPSVLDKISTHTGHLLVTMLQSSTAQVDRFKDFTNVMCGILESTDTVGVYMGEQSLLIPAYDYVDEASYMNDEDFPLNLWIYFGLQTTDAGNNGYTHGLKEFGKPELEIVNSQKSLDDIRGLLFNIAHYVLLNDINFKDGETVGLSEGEKILIEYSDGIFTEGKTYKLAY